QPAFAKSKLRAAFLVQDGREGRMNELQQTEKRIVSAYERIKRQRQLLARLSKHRRGAALLPLAEELLGILQVTCKQFRVHRKLIQYRQSRYGQCPGWSEYPHCPHRRPFCVARQRRMMARFASTTIGTVRPSVPNRRPHLHDRPSSSGVLKMEAPR